MQLPLHRRSGGLDHADAGGPGKVLWPYPLRQWRGQDGVMADRKRRVVIAGAGGRDFHNFNTVFRHDDSTKVVAFTAAQIPGIEDRSYPASLAGPLYPEGIPIVAEEELHDLISREGIDEVVLAYSDLPHVEVMHKASAILAAGADFRLLGPRATMLRSVKPVVAICAVRTGCGKSQTTRRVGRILLEAGLRVALVRHPMPYGDLEAMRVQRFASVAEIDASHPSLEEREEYEESVRMGMVMYAGVDYEQILRRAEPECDVVVWDGGNNDFPFFVPDLQITVVDPLRPGHELAYYPGETCLLRADVVVVNKIDSAAPADLAQVLANVRAANPRARVVEAASPVTLGKARLFRANGSLSSRTGPPSPTAACLLALAPSPPGTRAPRRSSTRVLMQSARSPPPTPATRASVPCCRPWVMGTSNWPSSAPRFAGRPVTSWSSARRWIWRASWTSVTPRGGSPTS